MRGRPGLERALHQFACVYARAGWGSPHYGALATSPKTGPPLKNIAAESVRVRYYTGVTSRCRCFNSLPTGSRRAELMIPTLKRFAHVIFETGGLVSLWMGLAIDLAASPLCAQTPQNSPPAAQAAAEPVKGGLSLNDPRAFAGYTLLA